MKQSYTRYWAWLLCCVLLIGLFTGCSKDSVSTSPSSGPTATPAPASTPTPSATEAPFEYPIPGNVELEYWIPMFAEVLAIFSDYNEMDIAKEAEKRTGVHINWVMPTSQNAPEIYNIMISSGDYSDLISSNLYTGGGDGAIADNVYVKLNDLIEKYAPNYTKTIESDESYYKNTRTDLGNMWAIFVLCAKDRGVSGGIAWREDIAADLGWATAPTSITEFDQFLQDAKKAGHTGFFSPPQFGFQTSFMSGLLAASFGASADFLNVDGTVQYGPLMPGYKDYLAQMKTWYADKIIDPDFMSKPFFMTWNDLAAGKYLVGVGVNGIVGSVYASNVSGDPKSYIAAIPNLDQADGTPVRSGNAPSYVISPTAITTSCENLEAAVRWMDYWFTEEGAILRNFGIEGYSFEYDANGKPQYTDLVANNPDIPVSTAMNAYAMYFGPGFSATIYESEDVKRASDTWADSDMSWNMPTGLSMTSEESSRYSAIMADVTTFCQESIANMITGVLSMDNYENDFVAKVKSLNIDEAVAIQQAALDRYKAR